MSLTPLSAVAVFAALHAQGSWGVAFAPDTADARPAVVFLHGMWSSPEEACPLIAPATGPLGFLVCPRGNAPLGGGKMWKGTYQTVAPALHRALDAAGAMAGARLDRDQPGTVMGYSNGAYFAVEVAVNEPRRWGGLVLLSMRLDPPAERLLAAGVRRVVLGAADQDASRPSMVALGERLARGGLPTRFVSLGPGTHELTADLGERLRDALAWVQPR